VPPRLSAQVRVLSSGHARKNDRLDTLATELAASRNGRLAAVDPEIGSEVLRLLSERREDLVAERTRALKAACTVYCGTSSPAGWPRRSRPIGSRPWGRLRRRLASEILRDIRTLDRKVPDLNGLIEAEVEASGTALTEIFGIGPILAAKIIGTAATWRASRPRPTSPPTRARRRWRPQAGRWYATGSLAGRQPQAQLCSAHDRHLPGQVGRSGRELLPQEDGGRQIP
jgi:transposase